MPPNFPPVSIDISCEAMPEMSCVGQPKEGKMNEICVWPPGKSHGMGKCKSCQRTDPKCMCQRFGTPRQCERDNFCGWSLQDNICLDKVNAAKDNAEVLRPRGPGQGFPPSGPSHGPSHRRPATGANPYGPQDPSGIANPGFSGTLKHALCTRQ